MTLFFVDHRTLFIGFPICIGSKLTKNGAVAFDCAIL
jgi:hypothetical protein